MTDFGSRFREEKADELDKELDKELVGQHQLAIEVVQNLMPGFVGRRGVLETVVDDLHGITWWMPGLCSSSALFVFMASGMIPKNRLIITSYP